MPNKYKLTTHGKQFNFYDSINDYGVSNQRIIIVCTSDIFNLYNDFNPIKKNLIITYVRLLKNKNKKII